MDLMPTTAEIGSVIKNIIIFAVASVVIFLFLTSYIRGRR